MSDNQWWKVDGDHYRVTIQMHHNVPPIYGDTEVGQDSRFSLWMHTGWDSFMVSEAFVGAGLLSYNEPAKEEDLMRKAFDYCIKNSGHAPPREDTADMDVFWLMGNVVELKRLANHWAAIATNDAYEVSGDDTYYDYYPDYLDGLWQLCTAINYPDPINKAITAALEGSYNGDEEAEDLLPDPVSGKD